MKKKILCAILAVSLCVGCGYCASKSILNRVYSNLPEKFEAQDYYVILRDNDTGVYYFKFYDKDGNLVEVIRRDNYKGNPYVQSTLKSLK